STTPAGLPHMTLRVQGFEGHIYQTHGKVAQEVQDAGGEAIEGARMPTGAMVEVEDLADSNPIEQVSKDFIQKYQPYRGTGPVNPFAGYSWDAMLILDAAAAKAVEGGAQPGTEAFRVALRDAMQSGQEVVGTNGVYKFTADDHYGLDERARVMITVKDGK